MLEKMPVKSKTFEVKGYGWEYEARVNPPLGVFLEKLEVLQTANKADMNKLVSAMYDILEMMLLTWNFKDEAGGDLPANREGLKKLPFDLLMAMIDAIKSEAFSVPLEQGSG